MNRSTSTLSKRQKRLMGSGPSAGKRFVSKWPKPRYLVGAASLFFSIWLIAAETTGAVPLQDTGDRMNLVPYPAIVQATGGNKFRLTGEIAMSVASQDWLAHAKILSSYIESLSTQPCRVTISAGRSAAGIRMVHSQQMTGESYKLEVTDKWIEITAGSLKGLCRGTATLVQMIGDLQDGLPSLVIEDQPANEYRSFMVDLGRNPHRVQVLKETIDLLWFYKVDSLHLHLTDDQRFAFPSTAFPQLWDGSITIDQWRNLEKYAVNRGITLIPELDVPGHSMLLRRHYPATFGRSAADLAGRPQARAAIKELLDEMLEVFTSTPYVHVGGDEASGVPETLQRNLINELHSYLKLKGKQTVVWEGPGRSNQDDQVNTEVIHLNWRTVNYPADQMLRDGYRVVNAAWDPLYLVDHFPRTNFTFVSPEHIYRNLAINRFKHVNPGISTFANPVVVDETKRLIGFCMPWWEGREENYVPIAFPRVIPMAEVAWGTAGRRDFQEFSLRSATTEKNRQSIFYPVQIQEDQCAVPSDGVFHNQISVELRLSESAQSKFKSRLQNSDIRYSTDGSPPNASSPVYQTPIPVSGTSEIRAGLFSDGVAVGHPSRKKFVAVAPIENLALGKPVVSSVGSASPFSAQRVTDGGIENLDFYLAYPAAPKPVVITIDLESEQTVGRVRVHAYVHDKSYEKYSVEVSCDGQKYVQVGTREQQPTGAAPAFVDHSFAPQNVRYIRIVSQGNHGYVFDSFSKIVEVQAFP